MVLLYVSSFAIPQKTITSHMNKKNKKLQKVVAHSKSMCAHGERLLAPTKSPATAVLCRSLVFTSLKRCITASATAKLSGKPQ